MAIRRYGVDIGRSKPVAETADLLVTEIEAVTTAVDAAVAAALLVPAIDADVTAEAAVALIGTDYAAAVALVGTTQGSAAVRVLVDTAGSPTKVQVVQALEAIVAHINASNAF